MSGVKPATRFDFLLWKLIAVLSAYAERRTNKAFAKAYPELLDKDGRLR